MSKLPTGWQSCGINEIARIVSGATPKTETPGYWDGDILWATPKDLGQLSKIELSDTERKISKAGYDSCSTTLLPIGSVLLTSRAPIGHLAINSKPMCTNQGFKSLIPNDRIENRYLYWVLKKYVPELQNMGRGCTFDEISKRQVESFQIPIPPLEEQRRIVSRIEELTCRADEARRLRKQAVDEADTQLFHVRRKLFEALSTECKTVPLNKCGTVIGGGTPSKLRHDYWVGNIPWISAKEMKEFLLIDSELKISQEALKESSAKLIPTESVLFVVRGSILYRHVPVAINAMPCTINQDMKAILPNKGILPYFLAHMMLGANDILKDMVEVAGNTAGKLETSRWSALKIPVPEQKKQRQIVEQLGRYQDKLTELHRLQFETESELKCFTPALLNKAFRGEL